MAKAFGQGFEAQRLGMGPPDDYTAPGLSWGLHLGPACLLPLLGVQEVALGTLLLSWQQTAIGIVEALATGPLILGLTC